MTGPAVPGFVVLIGGLVVASAALVLWLELVVRAAAVSVAVLFLPLALAALVWPSVAHWCRRLADTLVALVLSKLVMAAVLSLAASAVAGGLGASGSGNGGGFAAVVSGIALLVIAVLSPFTLLRLVPAVEAGAVAHLESTRHRLKSAAVSPVRTGGNLALDQVRQMKSTSQDDDAGAVGTVGFERGGGVAGAVTSAIPMIAGGVSGAGAARSAAAGADTGAPGGNAGVAPTAAGARSDDRPGPARATSDVTSGTPASTRGPDVKTDTIGDSAKRKGVGGE